MEKLASTPVLVHRAASFNERYSFGSNSADRNNFDAAAAMRLILHLKLFFHFYFNGV